MNSLERRILTTPLRPVRLLRKRRQPHRRYARREDDKDQNTPAGGKGGDGGDDDGKGKPAGGEEDDKGEKEGKDDDQGDGKEGRDGDSPGTIQGYAAVFHSEGDPGTEYELWSDPTFRAVERVAAGCFRAALSRQEDVRGLYNHEPDALLGRTSSGTMRLEEDPQGLRYEIDLPDTQTGRDVAELVDRGDLTGSSFGFVAEQESWREMEGENGQRIAIRTIESVRLMDVGPVTYPAYASTSAGRSANGTTVRALGTVEDARESYRRWKESQTPLEARLAAARARAVQLAV